MRLHSAIPSGPFCDNFIKEWEIATWPPEHGAEDLIPTIRGSLSEQAFQGRNCNGIHFWDTTKKSRTPKTNPPAPHIKKRFPVRFFKVSQWLDKFRVINNAPKLMAAKHRELSLRRDSSRASGGCSVEAEQRARSGGRCYSGDSSRQNSSQGLLYGNVSKGSSPQNRWCCQEETRLELVQLFLELAAGGCRHIVEDCLPLHPRRPGNGQRDTLFVA